MLLAQLAPALASLHCRTNESSHTHKTTHLIYLQFRISTQSNFHNSTMFYVPLTPAVEHTCMCQLPNQFSFTGNRDTSRHACSHVDKNQLLLFSRISLQQQGISNCRQSRRKTRQIVLPVYSSKTLSSFDVYGEMTWYTCNSHSRVSTREGQLPTCHRHKLVSCLGCATCNHALRKTHPA